MSWETSKSRILVPRSMRGRFGLETADGGIARQEQRPHGAQRNRMLRNRAAHNGLELGRDCTP